MTNPHPLAFGGRIAAVVVSLALGAYVASEIAAAPSKVGDKRTDAATTTPYLSANDLIAFAAASAAADRKAWKVARDLAANIGNAAARDVIAWRALTTIGSDAGVEEINQFLSRHGDWPGASGLRARATEIGLARSTRERDVIATSQDAPPTTTDGMLLLAEAYSREGKPKFAHAWIRRAWIEGNFEGRRARELARIYSSVIRNSDHLERASRLVWSDRLVEAHAMAPLLGAEGRALIQARVKLRKNARDAQKAYKNVPASLKKDPGLLFDQARWLRKHGKPALARPLLVEATAQLTGLPPSVDAWWAERQYQARAALDDGNARQAYELAAGHKLRSDSVVAFAEAEFLAGWIALRFLNKPDIALKHFNRLRNGVQTPTSVARAHYWTARAHASAGQAEQSQRQYAEASRFAMSYYGQLAAAALNPKSSVDVAAVPAPTRAMQQAFAVRDATQAMLALVGIDARKVLRSFATGLAASFDTQEEVALLAEFLRQNQEQALALRLLKNGSLRFPALINLAYPVIEVSSLDGLENPPEHALILSLIRQESEFDPAALSPAGARGLMQLMPATAKLTAEAHGIAYRSADELMSAAVNAQVGTAHLSDLIEKFAGSYVLAIASYNAGATRAESWVGRYGDPRHTGVDTVDWIERIPFGETRNYVQRVIETLQVYRSVLAKKKTDLMIVADLDRGAFGEPPAGREVPPLSKVMRSSQ